MKKQNNSHPAKLKVFNRIQSIKADAQTLEELITKAVQQGFKLYTKGNQIAGVISENDYRYSFATLDIHLRDLEHKIEAFEKQRNYKDDMTDLADDAVERAEKRRARQLEKAQQNPEVEKMAKNIAKELKQEPNMNPSQKTPEILQKSLQSLEDQRLNELDEMNNDMDIER